MRYHIILKFKLHDYKKLANLLILHQNLISMTGITQTGIINGDVKKTLLQDIKKIRMTLEKAEVKPKKEAENG